MILYSLSEYTSSRLLAHAKKETPDKYKRRTDSGEEWSLYRVGLLELTMSDDLDLYFKVHDYKVSIRIIGYKQVLLKYLDGRYKDKQTIAIKKSLTHAFKYNNIQVACGCPDFKYRYAYMATKKKYGFDVEEDRPAGKTNPKNQGGLCKHLIRVLNSPSIWIPKVIPAIRNYVKNQEER